MKFDRHQLLLLFCVAFLLPTFISAGSCVIDRECWPLGDPNVYKEMTGTDTKNCPLFCYSFMCIDSKSNVIKGSGCLKDLENACKFMRPDIKNIMNFKALDYSRNSFENIIIAKTRKNPAKRDSARKALQEELKAPTSPFAKNHKKSNATTCKYDDSPLTLERVQCRQGGECLTGKSADPDAHLNYTDVTCPQCVKFYCADGDRLMSGEGCFEDFKKICKNVPTEDMEMIEKGSKDYFYSDNKTTTMVSCSYGDNCHDKAVLEYEFTDPEAFKFVKKWSEKPAGKTCTFEPLPPHVVSTVKPSQPEPAKQVDNAANGFEFSGIIILGLIFIYLW